MQSLTVYAILRQFADPFKFRASFFGNRLPVWGPISPEALQIAHVAFMVVLFAFAMVIAKKALRERSYLPLPACLLVAAVLLVGFLGGQASGVLSLYIPAFFHGSQYLVVGAAAHLRGRGISLPETARLVGLLVNLTLREYWMNLVILATAIFALLAQCIALLGISFPVAFFGVFVTVNFHHFLADAFLWKLRDPVVRQLVMT